MSTADRTALPSKSPGPFMWLGIVLLVGALLAHVLAAQAIGGTYLAYRDHLLGFFGLSVISAAIVAGIGAKFWRGRADVTVLTVGVLQMLLGIFVYINRFSVHG